MVCRSTLREGIISVSKRVLVTGGAGFIGSHLVRRLLADGNRVRVIDNLSTGYHYNLSEVINDIEFIEGDLCSEKDSKRAVSDIEIIFHQAAIPSVPRSIQEPVSSVTNNVIGTTILLNAAVQAGVHRVVYAASSSAYGNNQAVKKTESLLPAPLSPYAVGKLTGEYLLQAFHHCYGIETVGTRYFNVFGERQDPTSHYSGVIAKFSKQLISDEQVTINGDGTISRDFTYVQNVVEGNMLASREEPSRVSGQIFNVACGGSISLNQLFQDLCSVLDLNATPIYGPLRKGDISHSCADIEKATKAFGYQPVVSFRDGLEKTVDWYKANVTQQNKVKAA